MLGPARAPPGRPGAGAAATNRSRVTPVGAQPRARGASGGGTPPGRAPPRQGRHAGGDAPEPAGG